jgi:hypothetical protein
VSQSIGEALTKAIREKRGIGLTPGNRGGKPEIPVTRRADRKQETTGDTKESSHG